MSVSVGQPGFYGRIDIGNFPQPRVIYARPIVIQPVPVAVAPQPIYLHVPPGHAKNWRKHCHKYNACNQPAYFVREEWYNNVYVPDYQVKHQGKGHGKGHKDDSIASAPDRERRAHFRRHSHGGTGTSSAHSPR